MALVAGTGAFALVASGSAVQAAEPHGSGTPGSGSAPAGPTYKGTVLSGAFADMYPVDVATTKTYYYVVDPGRYRIERVVRATGRIDKTTPGGVKGSGEGELAAARALAVDLGGNVYVADTPNHRIVKYDTTLQRELRKWGSKGSAPGQFGDVYGVAVGPGLDRNGNPAQVVYTVDDNRVQVFTTDGALIKVFATGFTRPRQVVVDASTGYVYVVNTDDRTVIAFDKTGRRKFVLGLGKGDGPGQFRGDPRGVAVTRDGKLIFVTDDGNRRVQAFARRADGTYTFAYAIGGVASSTFTDPRGLEITPDGKLLVADEWDYSLKEFTVTASGASLTRRLFGKPAPKTGANSPRGIALDSGGRIFVSDWWNQRIVRKDLASGAITAWGHRGQPGEIGAFNFQWGVAVQPGTNHVFVANRESHEVKVFSNTGTELFAFGRRGTAPGEFDFPHGITFAPDGTLWVTDSGNGRIQQFRVDVAAKRATFLRTIGSPGTGTGQFRVPTGVAVGADGTVWVADTQNSRIQAYRGGSWRTPIAKPTGAGRGFGSPWGVSVAPDGYIWVADTGAKRLVRMSTAGVYSYEVTGASAGTAAFQGPFQVVFDRANNLYMSDTWGNRVIKLGW